MRVLQAVRLVQNGTLALPQLWAIASRPERVQVALILGLPAELPAQAASPDLAWKSMNTQQRRLVLRHAPSLRHQAAALGSQNRSAARSSGAATPSKPSHPDLMG